MSEEKPSGNQEIPGPVWEQFSPAIKEQIKAQYFEITNNRTFPPGFENATWAEAIILYMRMMGQSSQPRRSWLRENLTGLMVVSAVMALAFGVLGAWGLSGGTAAQATTGFLDIAKLFAGALVGAAGATALGRK